MSGSELRKVPTDWLDHNDRKAAEAIAAEASSRQLSADLSPTNELEVIGISSGEVSPPSPPLPRGHSQDVRDMSTTENGRYEHTAASITEDDQQEGGLIVKLCGISRRIFAPVSYYELGTGRLLDAQILLVIRLLILFANGISAGFSYALREEVPVKFLLSELFLWLHLSFLFLLPLLLLSSLLTIRWNFLRDTQAEAEPKKGHGVWLTVIILYQVAMVLSQAELVRLFVMHSVTSLRPIVDHEGAELLFSLQNPFAAQRYVMVASTIIDSLISTVPLRGENSIPALLVFVPWTSASLFSRQTASSTAVKIGYLFGSSLLVMVLSLLNVLANRALWSRAQPRKEQLDDGQGTMVVDIV